VNQKKIICTVLLFFLFIGNLISLKAQAADSRRAESDSIPQTTNRKFKSQREGIWSVAIPAAMISYGVISIESDALKKLDYSTRDELIEDNSMWYNGWDDYFQFSPAVLAFGLKMGGMESKHKLSDMFILYGLSNLLESGVVYTAKCLAGRERPDGSNYRSFPSGHTATAFVAAEFLHQEYKDKPARISVGGYGMATLIGISRVYNNRHWVSDVVAGAGIGILSTKIAYWVYPSLQKLFSGKKNKYQAIVCPTYDNGAFGLGVSLTF
jgi:hypothetical protein